MPFPDIDPIAFSIGPLVVRWYALAYLTGFLGGWLVARRMASAEGLWGKVPRPDKEQIDDFIVWIALGVILGGRLGYVLFYDLGSYLARPHEILFVWQGGMSFHGGLLGAVIATFVFARRNGLIGLSMLDIVAVTAPIGLFFGRIANFINGELWGRPAPDFPFAVIFPYAGPVPRYPSQLFEAATQGLLLFIVMLIALAVLGMRRPGMLSGVFAIGYAVARIFCEFFREPDPQLGFLIGDWLTMGMLLSLPLALAGIAAIIAARRGLTGPGSSPPRKASSP